MLDGLVVKQLLGLNDDPLSAERGQYHFLQALLRTTAYGTLSRRDRKARHLAAASEAAALRAEAVATPFAALEATPWLDRARAISIETTTA